MDRKMKLINLQDFNYKPENNIQIDKEVIEFYYKNYIDVNYKAICKYLHRRNIHPKQLEFVPSDGVRKKKWEDNPYDFYLSAYCKNQSLLAKEIMTNGSYWPLVVHPIGKGCYKVKEGSHRIQSANLLLEKGYWKKERFQCLVLKNKKAFIAYNNLSPNEYVVMNIPVCLKQTYLDFFDGRFDINNMRQISEDLLEVTLQHGIEIYCTYLLYPFWLKNLLFKYNTCNPHDRIEPFFKLM